MKLHKEISNLLCDMHRAIYSNNSEIKDIWNEKVLENPSPLSDQDIIISASDLLKE